MPRTGTYDLDPFAYANGDLAVVSGGDWTHDPLSFGSGNVNVLGEEIRDNSGFAYALYFLAGAKTLETVDYIEVALEITSLPAKGAGEDVAILFIQTPSGGSSSSSAKAYELRVDYQLGTHKSLIIRHDQPGFPTLAEATDTDWALSDLLIGRLYPDGDIQFVRDRAGTESLIVSDNDTTYTGPGGEFFGGVAIEGAGTGRYDNYSFGTFTAAAGGGARRRMLRGVGR